MTRTVIIVEDNFDLAELEARALEDVAEVRIIGNDFDRAFRPETWQGVDVAVTDLMLPHVAGEDICRYLRRDFPLIRRVICTAKPVTAIRDLRDLAHVVLQKPFSVPELVIAVVGPLECS